MFGEYALYCGETLVALVCDDQLFVKITAPGKVLVGERYVEGFAYPGAKASILVGADDLEDDDRLAELIRVTAAALPAPKPKKLMIKKPKASAAVAKVAGKKKEKVAKPRGRS